jgi:DNA-binding XRE family transcriptional regulator
MAVVKAQAKASRAAVRVPRAHQRNQLGTDTALPARSVAPSKLSNRPLEASIGLEVRWLRKAIGWTVAELGMAAGISTGMLSKIENGSTSPSLSTLDALARALNVPITRLFAGLTSDRIVRS